jgi:pseudaminic acid synthase
MHIDGVKIGKNSPSYVVGEISANHQGKILNLFKLIDIAKNAGVNAVKVQAYTAETITLNSNKKDFRIKKNNTWAKHKNLYSLYKKAQTPLEWMPEIFRYCKKKKITVFASVFDESSLKILEKLNCPAYKIASAEITDIPLLKKVAKTRKPIIISTGLSNYKDLKLAYKTISRITKKIIILKCSSSYPSDLSELNLNTISHMKKKFKCAVGFSDHSLGINASILAAAIGADLVEKHFTLKKNGKGLDDFFSINPIELKDMVRIIKENEIAKGKVSYSISKNSKKNLSGRRSLYIASNIKKGNKFDSNNVKSIRPSYGLHPKYLDKILGKKAKYNLVAGQRMKLKYI